MKKLLILMLLGLTGMTALGAERAVPELDRVAAALQPVMATLAPAPEVKTDGASTLTVSYQTQTFKIHGASMAGEFAKEAHDETGPTFKGFVLSVSTQPKGQINQGMTPQILRRPYWQTYLQVTPVAGSDKQLFWGLSYGSRTDPALLARIRQAVESLKDAPNPAASAVTPGKPGEPQR